MIVFRCNADPQVGFGHLTRCRALAQELRDREEPCVMVGPAVMYASQEDRTLFDDWIELDSWHSARQDARRLLELVKKRHADFAVVDDYRADETYQQILVQSGLRWLQFEPLTPKPVWATMLVNTSPAARAGIYEARSADTQMLLGPRYALLRAEFAGRPPIPPQPSVRDVFVCFGGGSDRGAIKFVLTSLLPVTPSTVRFTVVSGAQNPANAELQDWIAEHGASRVRMLVNPPDVSELMRSCDIAISSGGNLAYELACCGLPMIIIAVAEDQLTASSWEELGCGLFLGYLGDLSQQVLTERFMYWLTHRSEAWSAARRAAALVDGRGSSRVADCLLSRRDGAALAQ